MAKSVRLDEAIRHFHETRVGDGVAVNTQRNDRVVLNRFLTETGNIYTRSVTERHIDDYFRALAAPDAAKGQGPLSPASINNHVHILTLFFRWARRHNYVARDYDPMGGKRRVRKVPPKDRFFIPVTSFEALLDAQPFPMGRMVIAFGLYLFVRQSEALTIKWQDVDFVNGTVLVHIHKTTDVDLMPMSAELEQELRRYMLWYQERVGAIEPEMYVCPARRSEGWARDDQGQFVRGVPLTSTIKPYTQMRKPEHWVQEALQTLEMPTFWQGVHTLRRSAARARFDALKSLGYDGALQHVRSLLHHASGTMTERYLGINIERKQRDDLIKGQVMFPTAEAGENVVQLRAEGAGLG